MESLDSPDAHLFERFRDYLKLLVRLQFGVRPSARIDPSDLVQQTLMEAFEKRAQFRGSTDDEQAAWLRTILARNVADAFRAQGRLKRDVNRERSLDQDLDESSARLGRWLAADQPSPSEHARLHEQAILLADALARLPELQREAVILRYWQGCSLVEIASSLDRTESAVAGLLKRGLKYLRTELDGRA
jgi:RNA polymerase sigma-70 factor (ECF subfamily)